MATLIQAPLADVCTRAGIRVVVADTDDSRRDFIRSLLDDSIGYVVIGETDSAIELGRLVALDAPELVIGPVALLLGVEVTKESFPLCIAVGAPGLEPTGRIVASARDPISTASFQESLATATAAVLNQKANELSTLIQHYVAHKDDLSQVPPTIEVEHKGGHTHISASAVLWMKSAGNYIRLFTATGVHVTRASIRAIADRLAHAGFVRVHRGLVVNLRSIRSQVVHNGGTVGVVLEDGTQLPVGPLYREAVRASLSTSPTQ